MSDLVRFHIVGFPMLWLNYVNQRTIGPVNVHLISGPRISIWSLAKGMGTAYTFIYLFSSAYQLISRSQAAIISKESITVTFFVHKSLSSTIWPCQKIGQDKPRVITWTNYDGLESQMLHTKFHRNRFHRFRRRCLMPFYHTCIRAWRPSWSCDQHHVNGFSFPWIWKLTYKIW